MNYSKTLTMTVALLLLCVTQLFAAEKFNYKMADTTESDSANSFYQPPSSTQTLENISNGQVNNVIFCIGDGMGVNHVALTRQETLGPDKKLYMERMPIVGLVRTYSANSIITDSAAAGTALACGIKTNNGMIGMTPDKTPYSSILEVLKKKGWRTGLVVTSSISHATPAVFASHVVSRNNQKEIALQEFANRVDVLLGGGRKFWKDETLAEATAAGYQVIDKRDALLSLKPGPVIGLFANDGMTTFEPEPSLEEMSQTAIRLLSSPSKEWFAPQPKFFMMIEGSQIDWAAHANDAKRVIRQTLLFDMAVKDALDFAQRDRHTLVIVTADHETGGLVLKDKGGKLSPEWTSSSHTAADVPVYAFGPGSEHFTGVMDNTEIPKRIAELTSVKEFPKQLMMTAETVSSK